MKQNNISLDKFVELAKQYGFSEAPRNHPAYSEGLSITFSSRTDKQSPQKAIVSLPTDSQSASDSQTNNEK
jgi:hypothetical protein